MKRLSVYKISITEVMSTFDDEYILQHLFSIQATFEGWMELMDDAVDSKEVFFFKFTH